MEARRIVIYGVTGSGKTTFARALSQHTGIPFHEVDAIAWEPGWVEVPLDEQRRRIDEICAGEAWILDSMYGKWIDGPLGRVQMIVALDYPFWFCFWRLLRRTIHRASTGTLVCNGNKETWRKALSRDSILLWQLRSFQNKRRRIRAWAANPEGRDVFVFRTAKQADAWLQAQKTVA